MLEHVHCAYALPWVIFLMTGCFCVSFVYLLELMLPDIFKPPPPVGAGGGYMFSGRLSVRPSMRPSVIHVVVLCFRDISSIC